MLRLERMSNIHEQGLIEPPVPCDPFALSFPCLHGQQHVERIARQTRQTKDNEAHDPEGQETLQQAYYDIALRALLLPTAPVECLPGA